MILLVVEGESDGVFFEYAMSQQSSLYPEVQIIYADGIDKMLQSTLPDAIKFLKQDLYTKVIAIFDWDKMHEPYGKHSTRIERLQELLREHPRVGGFPVRNNLEDLIENCLNQSQKAEFQKRKHKSKLAAVRWAIKQDLDQHQLKAKLTDLQKSLQCQLIRDFR